MLDDQTAEPTDYSLLDKALQGGFRQGEFNVIFGPCQKQTRSSHMLSEMHGWPLKNSRCDFISLIQGVDSDDFSS